jgi:hypothetical protein
MAEAIIPGGAYLSADGKTWHDANGKTIPNPTQGTVAATPPPPGKIFTQSSTEVTADKPKDESPAGNLHIAGDFQKGPDPEPEPVKKSKKAAESKP